MIVTTQYFRGSKCRYYCHNNWRGVAHASLTVLCCTMHVLTLALLAIATVGEAKLRHFLDRGMGVPRSQSKVTTLVQPLTNWHQLSNSSPSNLHTIKVHTQFTPNQLSKAAAFLICHLKTTAIIFRDSLRTELELLTISAYSHEHWFLTWCSPQWKH